MRPNLEAHWLGITFGAGTALATVAGTPAAKTAGAPRGASAFMRTAAANKLAGGVIATDVCPAEIAVTLHGGLARLAGNASTTDFLAHGIVLLASAASGALVLDQAVLQECTGIWGGIVPGSVAGRFRFALWRLTSGSPKAVKIAETADCTVSGNGPWAPFGLRLLRQDAGSGIRRYTLQVQGIAFSVPVAAFQIPAIVGGEVGATSGATIAKFISGKAWFTVIQQDLTSTDPGDPKAVGWVGDGWSTAGAGASARTWAAFATSLSAEEIGESPFVQEDFARVQTLARSLTDPLLGTIGDLQGRWSTDAGGRDSAISAAGPAGTVRAQAGANVQRVEDSQVGSLCLQDNFLFCSREWINADAALENLCASVGGSVPVNANHDPLPVVGRRADTLFALEQLSPGQTGPVATYAPGDYVLTWAAGDCKVLVGANAVAKNPGPGKQALETSPGSRRVEFTVTTPTQAGIQLGIGRPAAGAQATGLRVRRVDLEAAQIAGSQKFNGAWVSKLSYFKTLRFMECLGTNTCRLSLNSDMPGADAIQWVAETSTWPISQVIALAQAAGVDRIWYCLPAAAEDALVTAVLTALRDSWTGQVAVEVGNEVWRLDGVFTLDGGLTFYETPGLFPSFHFWKVGNDASETAPGSGIWQIGAGQLVPGNWVYSQWKAYAQRSSAVFAIGLGLFTGPNAGRFEGVLNCQGANLDSYTRFKLDCTNYHAASIAPYAPSDPTQLDFSKTFDALFAELAVEVQEAIGWISTYAAATTADGKQLWAYELAPWQISITGQLPLPFDTFNAANWPLFAKLRAFLDDQRMADLLNAWEQLVPNGIVCVYDEMRLPKNAGAYGLTWWPEQPTSSRWEAWKAWATAGSGGGSSQGGPLGYDGPLGSLLYAVAPTATPVHLSQRPADDPRNQRRIVEGSFGAAAHSGTIGAVLRASIGPLVPGQPLAVAGYFVGIQSIAGQLLVVAQVAPTPGSERFTLATAPVPGGTVATGFSIDVDCWAYQTENGPTAIRVRVNNTGVTWTAGTGDSGILVLSGGVFLHGGPKRIAQGPLEGLLLDPQQGLVRVTSWAQGAITTNGGVVIPPDVNPGDLLDSVLTVGDDLSSLGLAIQWGIQSIRRASTIEGRLASGRPRIQPLGGPAIVAVRLSAVCTAVELAALQAFHEKHYGKLLWTWSAPPPLSLTGAAGTWEFSSSLQATRQRAGAVRYTVSFEAVLR